MKNYAVLMILAGLFLLGVTACFPRPLPPATSTPDFTGYQPFPDGYGYMQENDQLAAAVKAGDRSTVRQHGWKLWAGISQQAQGLNWPVWYTWPNGTDVFTPPNATNTPQAQAPTPVSMLQSNLKNVISDKIPVPYYPVPQPVLDANPRCNNNNQVAFCPDGPHFAFNGDIMIATESMSIEAFDWMTKEQLYSKTKLDALHSQGIHQLQAPTRHIITKHMFWPVKASGVTAIPVWHEDKGPDYTGYAGYETWQTLVAVDPSGAQVGQTMEVSYLHGVYQPDKTTPWPTITAQAKVYSLDDFYYHKVTPEDWQSFSEDDKAILNAASYWAYNQPFEPNDYLVTVAMHVNTKEIPTWALQSVWWSDLPDAGQYAADRPVLPQAKGPWAHYLLVDAYGIPDFPGGVQPVGMNPYIELAIHPVATNCNTCHMRAGWPNTPSADKRPFASYQNPDCPDLLATLNPESACLKPLTLTDFQWIIPDRAQ